MLAAVGVGCNQQYPFRADHRPLASAEKFDPKSVISYFVPMNHRSVIFGLSSAALFGFSTPAAKALLGTVDPTMLAGLLYCGAGLGVTVLRRVIKASTAARVSVVASPDAMISAKALAIPNRPSSLSRSRVG